MVLYLCLIPNRGARIGHQSYEHFLLVTYCKKYNFNFIYHPFIGNSTNFETLLKFNTIYENNYDNINIEELYEKNIIKFSILENTHLFLFKILPKLFILKN